MNLKKSIIRCKNYRRNILKISQQVTALHMAGAFSSTEILDCIYNELMRRDNKENFIDTFLMSKGHSAILQYVILADLNIISNNDLLNYCKPGGILGAHPDYGNPGIEASTGSLGHGMGLAVGMHQADIILKNDKKIFMIVSDGELQEGSTWESMMMAANLNCKNIICFLDHNGSQSFGHTKETHPKFYPIKEKIISFGWGAKEIDGHNPREIIDAFNNRDINKPTMIICNTTKGKGVSFMENEPIWHYRSPTKEEYSIAIKEIDQGI